MTRFAIANPEHAPYGRAAEAGLRKRDLWDGLQPRLPINRAAMTRWKPIWWLVPGTLSLWLFAFLLTLAETEAAGRAYAAYGDVYILASLFWLWAVESRMPDRWDILGEACCILGAGLILFGPRGSS